MYLKSLEIAGFKSFAKKSSLDFASPITSIVGPNGSGKSNVAEAFRFVLGEQSIKSLRGKKGEDMIFNGSKDIGRQNRASVKVTFDNAKRIMDIDYDEVTIERVVHRDGINEYLVNGSLVRLKDIIELLARAHIGSSGHHIISQGEADRILNAGLKERRFMIEDALGLKIYQYKRQESERKLEKTEENIKSVESLRREILPHLKFLKKQVEKIEKTIEMKEELRRLYQEYFRREEEYLKFERKTLEEGKAPPAQKLGLLDEELRRSKEILAQSSSKDAKSDEVISLEEKLKAVRNEKDGLSRNIGRLEGMIDAEERRIKKLKEAGTQNIDKTVRLREVEELREKIDAHISEAEGKNDIGEIRNIFSRIRELISGFISQNKTAVDEVGIQESQGEIEKLQNEKKYFEEKLGTVRSDEEGLVRAYEALRDDIEKAKDSSRDAEKAVFKIMAEQNDVRSVLQALRVREEKLVIEEENFKRELQEAAILAGRQTLDFHQFVPVAADGRAFSIDEIVSESRQAQEDRRRIIEKIKIRLEDAGVGSSEEVMKEYREVSERDTFLIRELEDLGKSALSLKELIKELEIKLDHEFKEGVKKINTQFQEFFSLMFGGGTAELQVMREKKRKRSLTDVEIAELGNEEIAEEGEEEEGEEGIDIHVSLPRKKIRGLVMLSGGERALTSIALLFAVSQVNPPPFIILDETDAALDEANSRKYGDMIENLSKYSQLILITHNRETMSRAGVLYGVTMGADGGSKLLSIQFDEAVQVAK